MALRTHRVRYAETLSSLAARYYGNASRWEHIYQANRHYIADPNRLDPGQNIVIPHLVVDEFRHWLDPV
jgi:nucleoid-associated protein YgaU